MKPGSSIVVINKDGTQRLIKQTNDHRDQWYFEDLPTYIIFYKNYPVYIEVDGLVIGANEDWVLNQWWDIGQIVINTQRIKVYNNNKKWYQFWKPEIINYQSSIVFLTT